MYIRFPYHINNKGFPVEFAFPIFQPAKFWSLLIVNTGTQMYLLFILISYC